jgi:hypothetical protein
LEENKSFWRNHWFLIESWEGMFRAIIFIFLKEKGWDVGGASLEEVVEQFNQQEPFTGSTDEAKKIEAALLARLHETLAEAGFKDSEGLRKEFLTWGEQRAGNSKTWAFWWRFVLVDGWAYVALWLAVRSNDWNLRNVALKRLVALLRSWDSHYQREIPLHLAHLQQWPEYVMDALKAGLWTVSVSGAAFQSLALDEAREQLINLKNVSQSPPRPGRPAPQNQYPEPPQQNVEELQRAIEPGFPTRIIARGQTGPRASQAF